MFNKFNRTILKHTNYFKPLSIPYKSSSSPLQFSPNIVLNSHSHIKEKYLYELQKNPLSIYKQFYENQYITKTNREVIKKITLDISSRLTSIKNMKLPSNPELSTIIDRMNQLQGEGTDLSVKTNINVSSLYRFVIGYIDTLYNLIKFHDNDITGSYHTNFTKSFIYTFFDGIGKNTQLFFTFENVDDNYLIDIRPTCIYLNHLLSMPDFFLDQSTKKLLSTKDVQKSVEGNILDFKENAYHDLGHSYVMGRQDHWLFETSNIDPVDLVSGWIENMQSYKSEISLLSKTNPGLYKAVRLYLFDVVHDRGYQFDLAILRQQFRAMKNRENLKTKISKGSFKELSYVDDQLVQHIDLAQEWLIRLTEQLITKNNTEFIKKSVQKQKGYIIKRYPDIESYRGVPVGCTIGKDGRIHVTFSCGNNIIRTTTIYEIELLGLPVQDNLIFTKDKIDTINKWISLMKTNDIDQIRLDSQNGDIIVQSTINPGSFKEDEKLCLKGIEIYKLERLYKIIRDGQSVMFSISSLPSVYESFEIKFNQSIITIDNGLSFGLNEVAIEPMKRSSLKYINLNPMDRFVDETVLRRSYVKSYHHTNPNAKPYVELPNGYELGIVDTQNTPIAKAVSSLLSRSIDRAKDIYPKGYLPSHIVERAQLEYVSPHAVSNLWGRYGYRFVLSKPINPSVREIVGTALIASSKDNLFFFTSKYNNLKKSTLSQDVNFYLTDNSGNRWFDKFSIPDPDFYAPAFCNQLANFAIEINDSRGSGLGRMMIESIIKHYAVHYKDVVINHSQPLICGKGLFQIADPSWLNPMLKIGFKVRAGAETFYLDKPWDPLSPIIIDGQEMNLVEYNKKFNLFDVYSNKNKDIFDQTDEQLMSRVESVMKLATLGFAKLQYYQLVHIFNRFTG